MTVLHKNIQLNETGLVNKLVADYIQQKEAVKPFYQYAPEMGSFDEVISNRPFDQDKRNLLADVLLNQYENIGIQRKQAESVFANIDALRSAQTFTVTTGHQLSLFTGPLFFVYKILSTIRLAQELNQRYPNHSIVPVFWLASEDHDFAEINHIHLKGAKLQWNFDSKQQPVGILQTKSIKPILEELRELLGANNKLIDLFEQSYASSNNLSEATRKLVHALFGQYGLVMIEPNDVRLKREFIPIIKEDAIKHNSFAALLETNSKLDKQYPLQVTGREINFFYMSEAGRQLIKKTRSGYEVANTGIVWSEQELNVEIESHPERFSPNVVMRPVYQEHVLPNLAYIGGPGEVSYWLQLKGVFETHQVPFPMVVLRNSVMLISQAHLHKLTKKGVDVEDLFKRDEEWIKEYIHAVHPITIAEETEAVGLLLQQAIDKVMVFDNQIGSRIIEWKVEALHQLKQLQKELNQSKKQKSKIDTDAVIAIKNLLFPGGVPQERVLNLAAVTGNYYEVFLSKVAEQLFPLSNTIDVLVWD